MALNISMDYGRVRNLSGLDVGLVPMLSMHCTKALSLLAPNNLQLYYRPSIERCTLDLIART
jgi:hypothetical protein